MTSPSQSSASARAPASKSSASRHVCPDCGRTYKAAETLTRHRKNHFDTTPYVCRVCNASFKRKDLLDRHTQIHVRAGSPSICNRGQRACARCSRLKTRCDNLTPCSRCARAHHACTYKNYRPRAQTERSSTSSPTQTASSLGSNHHTPEYHGTPSMASHTSMPELRLSGPVVGYDHQQQMLQPPPSPTDSHQQHHHHHHQQHHHQTWAEDLWLQNAWPQLTDVDWMTHQANITSNPAINTTQQQPNPMSVEQYHVDMHSPWNSNEALRYAGDDSYATAIQIPYGPG